jgi:uncharacterized protein (DUF433 family)
MTDDDPNVTPTDDGGYRIAGTRVSLDSVVHAYWDGRTPESIVADFPSLTPERVHGALAYYLRNRERIDRHLAVQSDRFEQLRRESESRNAELLGRVRRAGTVAAGAS